MSRRTALVALALGVPLVLAGAASAQTCVPGAPSSVPCLPGSSPSPSASPTASPSASPSASPTSSAPALQPAAAEPAAPTPAPAPAEPAEGVAPAPVLDAGVLEPPAMAEEAPAPDAVVAPPLDAGQPADETLPEVEVVLAQAPQPVAQAPSRGSVAQSLAGAFALVVGVLLALPLLLALLAGRLAASQAALAPPPRPRAAGPDGSALRLTAAGLPAELAEALSLVVREAVASTLAAVTPSAPSRSRTASTTNPSGAPVNPTGNRLYLALGCLGLAALAGFVGWYQLSANPNVNEQLPYLASAGVIVVIASAVGGALLVADQLRGDDRRLEDLEEAVRDLAAALAPSIEAPARRQVRELAAPLPREEDPRVLLDEQGDETISRPARTTRVTAPRRSRTTR